jgi:coenzyme F420-reducing hydrogenase delta subunit
MIKLLCSGKLEPIHLMKAFEAGADAVFVAG